MDTTELAGTERSSTARKETFSLRLYSFSAYSTAAMVVSFIPLYFLDRGFSEQQIGIIYSTGPFISIFANIILGMASDKFRTIKKLLMLLLFGQLVMISLLFPIENFALVCLVMMGFYFFQTPINPLSDSLLLLSSSYTGTPYALVRIFGSLGFAVTAYTFGLILKEIGSAWTLPLALCTIAITLALTTRIRDYQGSARKIDFSGFFKLLRQRDVLLFFLIILTISIPHRMYEGFLAVTMRQMGASDSLVGLAWLVSALSEIPILFLLGKYGHKFKELPLLMIASIMYAIRLWLLSDIQDPRWVIATQAMHSISFGIYFSTALRYLSRLIPDEYRASGQAVYAVVWTGLAGVISGMFGGYVYEHFGRETFFKMGAGFAIVAAAAFLARYYFSRSER
ncbi:PPP family 3-phenylpropionic acid transporter [Paenibacillus endophyticus]|uniref:PPP family 3-phenylpropionic acid transporter n=1 Tax=Paenibacillus endophyticus TaxID=1294268 RepID=A0A7W5G9D3_9BACL|nr:MFS transporter [Paenibacillus endophyticus]MBB3151208.1 PPP family 3-phenylpropionic acid transporter [Paenibacillus endophyticus]